MENYRLYYYQSDTRDWKQVPVTRQTFSIGRAAENDLVLKDGQVSHQHASLYIDARGIWIYDQNSTNGVIVGGQRIAANEWKLLTLNEDITIGVTTLRVEFISPGPYPSQSVDPAAEPARVGQPRRKNRTLALVFLLGAAACVLLVGGGFALWKFLPNLLSSPQAVSVIAPPTVLDSLPVSTGGGRVQDEYGVSLVVTPPTQGSVQQASLVRANLSQGMRREIEKAYQVESLAYSVQLQHGQDGIGSFELALPAPSPGSHLAVLVDGQYLGILETPAQDGFFHINPGLSLVDDGAQDGSEPQTEAQAPNSYLVLTPRADSAQILPVAARLASPLGLDDADGISCITEFWTVTDCWRNTEGTVYVFWGRDVPEDLADTEMLRITDTINTISEIMSFYRGKSFSAAAISPSNHIYIVIEAGAKAAYIGVVGWSNVNLYVPWDLIRTIATDKTRCTFAHELVHWMEKKKYWMNKAASLSSPQSWWLDNSAEIGSFMFNTVCIENNLKEYGSTTKGTGLGFQAAPLQWAAKEESLYIHALQLYLSICEEGGSYCTMSEQEWVRAIDSGSYPMNSSAVKSYEVNAKNLGLFLLGSAPVDGRVGADIPPSTNSGEKFGDYLNIKSEAPFLEYGYTTQFTMVGTDQVDVRAGIGKGGVYPLRVTNGGVSPGGISMAGLPGLLEIQAGPAFWLKQGETAPVFYPKGTTLKLGPISDLLGMGKVRIVAIAPDAEETFAASLSLADFSGDWSVIPDKMNVTLVDCPGYESTGEEVSAIGAFLLQFFSGYGTYVKDGDEPQSLNLSWEGTLPEEVNGSSEVTVDGDIITLHYLFEIPASADTGGSSWLPWIKPDQMLGHEPLQQHNALLSVWPALLVLGVVTWPQRLPRKWAWLALTGLLLLGGLLFSSCVGAGLDFWGTIDATYTFDKLEYVNPQQAGASIPDAVEDQPEVTWRLTNGQGEIDVDFSTMSEITTLLGDTVKKTETCKLTATGPATGTIGPDGSVDPPDTGD